MMNMKKTIILLILSLVSVIFTMESFASSFDLPKPKDNEAAIYISSVAVPLNRISLIRKNSNYCAVRFTKCWTELDEERLKSYGNYPQESDLAIHFKELSERKFVLYESYYQDDGTGDFTNKNVQISQGKASWLPPVGRARLLIHQPGDTYVICGPHKLEWDYKTLISVIPYKKYPGDYGFEAAPTPWTDIKEVNIKDPRIKWYRYDEKRERVFIPIDKLWEK